MNPSYTDLLRTPDHILFQYEDSGVRFEEPDGREEVSARIDCTVKDGALAVTLYPSERPVSRVKLRFDADLTAALLCLGDGWERIGLSTADTQEGRWTGIEPRRRMPWYFHLYDGVVKAAARMAFNSATDFMYAFPP